MAPLAGSIGSSARVSEAVAHGLNCSCGISTCEISLDQGWKLSHNWQEDSYPLCHQGSPATSISKIVVLEILIKLKKFKSEITDLRKKIKTTFL